MSEPRDIQVAEPETTTIPDVRFNVMSDDELDKPYRVILQNDDITPMELVVWVLESIFKLSFDQSYAVMMEAHVKGRALVAVLPFDKASSRVYSAQSRARDMGFPLTLYLEPDE